MRLLVFSDLHLDTAFLWAPPVLARARRQALRDTLTRIVDLAERLNVDVLCSAGDLYEHERFAADTGEFLRATFAAAGRPVLLAPGNHDWVSRASLYTQIKWSDNVTVFTEDRLIPHRIADGFTIWGGAHRAPANTDGFLNRARVDRSGVNIALFHGSEIHGMPHLERGQVPHAPFNSEQVQQAGFVHALVGHFHTPFDGPWHTYPGNPEPLAFGETGERGAVEFDFADDGAFTRTRHAVAGTRVSDVTVDLTGVQHGSDVRDRVAASLASLRGVVRATLMGEVGPEVDIRLDELTGVAPQLQGLLLRTADISAAYNLDALAAEPTVRGQFVQDVLADRSLDEDTRRRVVITGLRAFEIRTTQLEVV